MTGIIVTGHGNCATGLVSALKLLVGEPDHVAAVDFEESQSTDELKANIRKEVDRFEENILIMTDIKGGSPYNQSVLIKTEVENKAIEVISGTNLPMLILGVLERQAKTADELLRDILINGRNGIDQFVLAAVQPRPQDEDEGI